MKLFPDGSYKIAFGVLFALAAVGVFTLIKEPEYPEGGWFALILGVAGMALVLYKGATRRPGQ